MQVHCVLLGKCLPLSGPQLSLVKQELGGL